MVQGTKYKTYVSLTMTHDEFEYLMMGLHAMMEKNYQNAEKFGEKEMLNHEDEAVSIVDEIFAPQHVEMSRMVDQMTSIFGYDPAVEG